MKKSIFLLLLFIVGRLHAQTNSKDQPVQRPKLVVGIVVDQMRYDYVYRYWNKFGNDGFKKLVNEGFFCKNTNYNYVPTYTGPGHASVYTGTTPAVHGIIANNWWDRNQEKMIGCVEDQNTSTIGSDSKAGQASPKNLLATTVGDELKLASNKKSKVIGLSFKDRSAILPAGHVADAAYWFDSKTGNWITSSYYRNDLPVWLNEFNKKEQAKKYLSKDWETLLPIDQYTESIQDDNAYEEPFPGEQKPVFPHQLQKIALKEGPGTIIATPFGNTFLKDLALETIKAEALGKDEYTDFLAISFSSTDYVGHQFGPSSIEVEDTYLRLDRDIAELIAYLEKEVGKNNFLLFLTADHGAAEVPNFLIENKIPAGYFDETKMVETVKNFLAASFGDSLFLKYYNQQIYLDRERISRKKLDLEKIQQAVAEQLMSMEGTANALKAADINQCYSIGDQKELIQKGFYPKRSGDVVLILEPSWMENEKTGTTHGSGYHYDTHVPLIWYGYNIKNGSSTQPVFITDIAPTLSLILNIQFPNGCTGKPINLWGNDH